MRLALLVRTAALASALSAGLAACESTGPGLSSSFDTENYRRSAATNGTQRRPDVNRTYTQPSLPTIANRGY